jgi:hypothetical protein
LTRIPGRTVQLNGNPQGGKNDKDRTVDSNLRQRIRAVMEDLWHWKTETLSNRSGFSNWANRLMKEKEWT